MEWGIFREQLLQKAADIHFFVGRRGEDASKKSGVVFYGSRDLVRSLVTTNRKSNRSNAFACKIGSSNILNDLQQRHGVTFSPNVPINTGDSCNSVHELSITTFQRLAVRRWRSVDRHRQSRERRCGRRMLGLQRRKATPHPQQAAPHKNNRITGHQGHKQSCQSVAMCIKSPMAGTRVFWKNSSTT